MKFARIALSVVSSALLTACAYVPLNEGISRRVSPDYTATGAVEDVRAYVYGARTVLEFDGSTPFLIVKDISGNLVEYERVGRLYRLNSRLDNFTVWVNGRSATFSSVTTTRVFSAPSPLVVAKPELVKLAIAPEPLNQGDVDLIALLKLSEKQLEEVRQVIDASSKNPNASSVEMLNVNSRLDEIEARLVTAAAAIIQVSFQTNSTTFTPSADVARVLIDSAKSADRVNVHGHTDSRIAGPIDAKIALGRAIAARKFLMDNGVQSEKIKVFSQAAGGFIAPNTTNEGRALNRRVEVEFVNVRIAELKGQAVKLTRK